MESFINLLKPEVKIQSSAGIAISLELAGTQSQQAHSNQLQLVLKRRSAVAHKLTRTEKAQSEEEEALIFREETGELVLGLVSFLNWDYTYSLHDYYFSHCHLISVGHYKARMNYFSKGNPSFKPSYILLFHRKM